MKDKKEPPSLKEVKERIEKRIAHVKRDQATLQFLIDKTYNPMLMCEHDLETLPIDYEFGDLAALSHPHLNVQCKKCGFRWFD